MTAICPASEVVTEGVSANPKPKWAGNNKQPGAGKTNNHERTMHTQKRKLTNKLHMPHILPNNSMLKCAQGGRGACRWSVARLGAPITCWRPSTSSDTQPLPHPSMQPTAEPSLAISPASTAPFAPPASSLPACSRGKRKAPAHTSDLGQGAACRRAVGCYAAIALAGPTCGAPACAASASGSSPSNRRFSTPLRAPPQHRRRPACRSGMQTCIPELALL